jgi:hypothetical protein
MGFLGTLDIRLVVEEQTSRPSSVQDLDSMNPLHHNKNTYPEGLTVEKRHNMQYVGSLKWAIQGNVGVIEIGYVVYE